MRMQIKLSARTRKCWIVSSAAFTALLLMGGCGASEPQTAKMTSFSSTDPAAEKNELFTVPAEQMSHIQVVTVAPQNLERILRLTGAIAYNSFQTTPVISQIGGPVSRIVVTPGQKVKAGDPMLYVTSPDYSMLRSGFIKARDSFHLADRAYIRAQDLYAHKAISQADLENAESARVQAEADMQANEQAIRILGITDPEKLVTAPVSSEVPVLAPQSGEVVERLCSPGQLLQAGGTQCFTLSDMSSVWVLVNVYQNDLRFVHVGDEATIESDAFPGVMHGKISYLSSALDPTTRTLQARIETPNPGERLKRDMYVNASVKAGTIANALSVPDASVLRDDQNMPYVYIQTANNQFARHAVTLGDSQDGKTQILSGLKVGDKIVGDGSLFLQFQNSLQR